jgi:hypothetical protein
MVDTETRRKQRVSDDPSLTELGNQRARVYAAVANHGPLFSVPAEVRAYRDALARCDVPADVLDQARAELEERLAAGYEQSEFDARLEGRWIVLLVRHEAVCDALDPTTARRWLSMIEARVYAA